MSFWFSPSDSSSSSPDLSLGAVGWSVAVVTVATGVWMDDEKKEEGPEVGRVSPRSRAVSPPTVDEPITDGHYMSI